MQEVASTQSSTSEVLADLNMTNNPFWLYITVAVSRPVTALQLSVAHDSSGAVTYRHLLSAGPLQVASAARRVL
jgi:hypothetical protein